MLRFNPFTTAESYARSAPQLAFFTFLTSVTLLCGYFYFMFPGILSVDYIFLLSAKSQGVLNSFQSHIYSLLTYLLLDLGGTSAIMGFFQIFLSSAILAYIVYHLVRFKIRPLLVFVSVLPFLILPSIFLYTFLYSRDILYSWLVLLLLSSLFFKYSNIKIKKNWPKLSKVIWPLLLAVIIGAMRFDGMIFSLGGLLFYLWVFRDQRQQLFKIIIHFIFYSLLINYFIYLPFQAKYQKYPIGNDYYTTVILNPLSYILKNRQLKLSPQDQRAIENIVALKDLTRYTRYEDDFTIPMYHDQKVKKRIPREELISFFKVFAKIALSNSDLFLKNRLRIMINTLGIARYAMYFHEDYEKELSPNIIKTDFRKDAESKKKFKQLLTATKNTDLSRNILWSSLWSLLLIIGVLCCRRLKGIRYLCLLLFLRTLVVFFLAPAPHFMYLFSNYLFGFVLLAYLFIELKKETAPSPSV